MSDEPPSSSLQVEVAVAAGDWAARLPGAEAAAVRAALAAWRGAPRARAAAAGAGRGLQATVVLADDAMLRRLNRTYRGRDRATNVLAFPHLEPGEPPAPAGGEPAALGDVVLSLESLEREARAQAKAPADHLSHLVVHGLLHLVGYDHGRPAEAAEMEALEARILAGLGMADPYGEAPAPAGAGGGR